MMNIGYVPLRRDVFDPKAAMAQREKTLQALAGFDRCNVIDIGSINEEGLLFDEKDLSQAIEILKKAKVDGLLLAHNNFGTEHLGAKIAKAIGKPVALWGPRDDAPAADGTRERDSQCGLFATGKVLRRFNVPFTYIVNSHVEDALFRQGFSDFLGVCSVVKSFSSVRILQVSTRPNAFWTMMCNEGELLEKFNVQVYPITLIDLQNKVIEIKNTPRLLEGEIQALMKTMDTSVATQGELENIAALKVALRYFAKIYSCNAIALQCWFSMQAMLGVMPCVANGLLTDEGLPTVCETDIHGAISSIMLQAVAMNTKPIFFADMTIRHPDNDNAELLWHCGNFPPSLATNKNSRKMDSSFILESKCPGIGSWEIKGGDVTICRFDGDHGEYRLFIGEGKGTQGPMTSGTYLWMEVGNWPAWEKKLVTGPYVHHCVGIHGKYAHILLEACKYIPGLLADTMEPTLQELEKRLLGS